MFISLLCKCNAMYYVLMYYNMIMFVMLQCVYCVIFNNYLQRAPRLTYYITNNLQNSNFELCFCTLRNTPVDLLKTPFEVALVCNCTVRLKKGTAQ